MSDPTFDEHYFSSEQQIAARKEAKQLFFPLQAALNREEYEARWRCEEEILRACDLSMWPVGFSFEDENGELVEVEPAATERQMLIREIIAERYRPEIERARAKGRPTMQYLKGAQDDRK